MHLGCGRTIPPPSRPPMPVPPPPSLPMPPPDSAWLRMEDAANPMTITGVMGFPERMERGRFAALLRDRLLHHARFQMRVEDPEARRTRWVPETPFDIDAHVLDAELPAPGGHAGLERLAGTLMSTPMDFGRSPWTMHVVHDVDEDTATAIVVRVHHCIGDGIALMHVLLAVADERYEAATAPAARPRRPRRSARARIARTARGALGEAVDLLRRPSHAAHRLAQIGGGIAALGGLLVMRKDSRTVFKGHASADKRAAWTAALPLVGVRRIADAGGTKINDVLLAAAAGALRRYLLAEGQPVGGVELRAAVPFNVRPLTDVPRLGNEFALVFVLLPTHLDTPRARLEEVQRRMLALKGSSQPAVVYGILQSIGVAPDWAHEFVVDLFSSKASAVLTNVPGPREPLHFDGVPLGEVMFWVPQAGDIGLGLSLLSYAETVRVGVTTDAAYAGDPSAIAACFDAEFDALAEAVGVPPPRGGAGGVA